MADQPQSHEQDLWELTAAAEAAIDEVALNDRVYKAVDEALGRIVRDYYPGMGNWHAEQLRQLADKISRHAAQFTIEVSNLDSAGHRQP